MLHISPTFLSFFIFGLVNNVLYVIILTAAHDLVSPTTPKSLILLADILPAFLLKLALPWLVKQTTHRLRLAIIVALSASGMFLTSLALPLYIVLLGVVLASLSSGLGETTFLQLSHFHNQDSSNTAIHGWSSGTGAAGLIGAGLILVLTTIFKLPIDVVLRFCSLFPFIHLYVYYCYLPTPVLYITNGINLYESTFVSETTVEKTMLTKMRNYFWVYMLPLSVVYFAEYTINQGVAPTMLFPLEDTPFDTFRDSYVAYGTLYQVGVFISRSSGSFIKLHNLYLMGILQFVNLAFCILQSMYMLIPNIWVVFLLILYEGLLGGAAYVNTFMKVSDEVGNEDREFALGCVGVSDSFGIVLAAIISLWLEPKLCGYQVGIGRNWCTKK
ncbi:Protein BTN1 [Pichia kudriavzevii]|uniref:Protein BTN n=1 Tax=Pichia kudriavzevii TaxID=4909 RepID=A0A1V2LIE0_PICKU|nr:Protein BTN1 [Pichia kudriavzevii]